MSVILTSIKKNPIILKHNRYLFHWVNLQFNAVDKDRRKLVGPDRVCAEWILRNGGKVKWSLMDKFESDYNKLPDEKIKIRLQEIDASNSTIMHNGFDHLVGCNYITKMILHHCNYMENEALEGLRHIKDTLEYLQITSCGNIYDDGLMHLIVLKKLKDLKLADLQYVKNKNKVLESLQKNLPQCKIDYR